MNNLKFFNLHKFFPIILLFILTFTSSEIKLKSPKILASVVETSTLEVKINTICRKLKDNNTKLPDLKVLSQALAGFYDLKERGVITKDILTVVDFTLSSTVKRLWVIDLSTNAIVYNTLVAHGRNTGEEFAKLFSNSDSSYKSSLGFYATGETYNGKHGVSLKLDGLEKGYNDNARSRGVVVHGADYVSDNFIKSNKRLGRSQGCPALPVALTQDIISIIKNKSCLYIYHSSRDSKFRNVLFS